jgi:hypothetical protein
MLNARRDLGALAVPEHQLQSASIRRVMYELDETPVRENFAERFDRLGRPITDICFLGVSALRLHVAPNGVARISPPDQIRRRYPKFEFQRKKKDAGNKPRTDVHINHSPKLTTGEIPNWSSVQIRNALYHAFFVFQVDANCWGDYCGKVAAGALPSIYPGEPMAGWI